MSDVDVRLLIRRTMEAAPDERETLAAALTRAVRRAGWSTERYARVVLAEAQRGARRDATEAMREHIARCEERGELSAEALGVIRSVLDF